MERVRLAGQRLSSLTSRSTGFRSLQHHIWGHASDIAAQAPQPCHKSEAYNAICWQAAEERVIPLEKVLGRWQPQHESRWTGEQAMDVVTLCHRFADERGYWLREYDETGKAEKVWYGERRQA